MEEKQKVKVKQEEINADRIQSLAPPVNTVFNQLTQGEDDSRPGEWKKNKHIIFLYFKAGPS